MKCAIIINNIIHKQHCYVQFAILLHLKRSYFFCHRNHVVIKILTCTFLLILKDYLWKHQLERSVELPFLVRLEHQRQQSAGFRGNNLGKWGCSAQLFVLYIYLKKFKIMLVVNYWQNQKNNEDLVCRANVVVIKQHILLMNKLVPIYLKRKILLIFF